MRFSFATDTKKKRTFTLLFAMRKLLAQFPYLTAVISVSLDYLGFVLRAPNSAYHRVQAGQHGRQYRHPVRRLAGVGQPPVLAVWPGEQRKLCCDYRMCLLRRAR